MTVNYGGMTSRKDVNCAYISFWGTVDPYDPDTFSFESATSFHTKNTYLSEDGTIEDIYPCVFVTKEQAHDIDNPTYKYVLRDSTA